MGPQDLLQLAMTGVLLIEGKCPIPHIYSASLLPSLLLGLHLDEGGVGVWTQHPKVETAVSIVDFLRDSDHLARLSSKERSRLVVLTVILHISSLQVLNLVIFVEE
jgi:hypothetical protein